MLRHFGQLAIVGIGFVLGFWWASYDGHDTNKSCPAAEVRK